MALKTILGDKIYIILDGMRPKGYDAVEWDVVLPAVNKLKTAKDQIMQLVSTTLNETMKPVLQYVVKTSKVIQHNPYKDKIAQVRIGNELCPAEKAYLEKRIPRMQKTIEKILGKSVDKKYIPRIALVESGGGYRAMLSSIGWHVGLSKLGIMDAVTYIVGLSGSTWSIGPWMLSGLSIEEYKQKVLNAMGQDLYTTTANEFLLIANNLLVKAAFDQELTIVDLYGGLLANVLLKDFGDMRQIVGLSQQAEKIADGGMPFPIYTAVRADDHAPQEWYEFTPYEIGGEWLGMYIDSWAYNRVFNNGISQNFSPEQSLGFLMGTFGAGMAATIEQTINQVTKNKAIMPPLDQVADTIIRTIGNQRVTTAIVNNFSLGMDNSPIKDLKKLKLADAATEFNLPYPPVSGQRRAVDIIVFLDAGEVVGGDLRKIEKYAKERGLKLPTIEYQGLGEKAMSVFSDSKDARVPTIIYMPLIANNDAISQEAEKDSALVSLNTLVKGFDVVTCIKHDYCKTANFRYAKNDAERVTALTERNVRLKKDVLLKAIADKVAQLQELHASKN